MGLGDDALAGNEEEKITCYFPPDPDKDRYIWFRGHYLSIYNKETQHYATHIDTVDPETTSEKFKVPAGYAVYVRVGTVRFEV